MRDITRPPRSYELMTILTPDVPEDEVAAAVDQIGGYVTAAGGTVIEVLRDSPWGRRRLAYAIRHGGRDVRDGYYTVYHIEMAPAHVIDVEREIKLNDRIMRYLVTHYTPGPPQPESEATAVAPDATAQLEAAEPEVPAAAVAPEPEAVAADPEAVETEPDAIASDPQTLATEPEVAEPDVEPAEADEPEPVVAEAVSAEAESLEPEPAADEVEASAQVDEETVASADEIELSTEAEAKEPVEAEEPTAKSDEVKPED